MVLMRRQMIAIALAAAFCGAALATAGLLVLESASSRPGCAHDDSGGGGHVEAVTPYAAIFAVEPSG